MNMTLSASKLMKAKEVRIESARVRKNPEQLQAIEKKSKEMMITKVLFGGR